jgi:hypothetical protein
VTQHDGGFILDFPLAPDDRARADRRAWSIFTIAIVLLVGSLVWFSACQVLQWQQFQGLGLLYFVLGILGLIAAVTSSSSGRNLPRRDDDLRQLSVADNLLIRTARDHRKQVWYRQEILAIEVESKIGKGAHLVLALHSGERVILLGDGWGLPAQAFRSIDEMEWIAAALWQALLPKPPSHAIQNLAERATDTRISSDLP